jgi:NADH-quinone oxidoreductase subunit E
MRMSKQLIEQIIDRYERDSGMLIPMMQDLQAEFGYLSADDLRGLSKQLDIPLTRIYGVATFYSSFRLAPRGQHDVTLCMGTVCYLKGAPRISEAICNEFGVQPGGTTSDRLFTLQAVNCVGACALAPVMIVDGKYYDGVTPDLALDIIRGLASEEDLPAEERLPAEASSSSERAKSSGAKSGVVSTTRVSKKKGAAAVKKTADKKAVPKKRAARRSGTRKKSSRARASKKKETS